MEQRPSLTLSLLRLEWLVECTWNTLERVWSHSFTSCTLIIIAQIDLLGLRKIFYFETTQPTTMEVQIGESPVRSSLASKEQPLSG